MTAMTSSALGAVLVQPLPARVTAFRPVSRSVRTPVVAQASSAQNQVAQKLAVLGTAAATALTAVGAAHADVVEAAARVNDNRAAIVATLFVPALGWVAFNILGPALNQYQNMRLKSVATGLGLGAASLLLAQQADAANQIAEVAGAGDNRAAIVATLFVPALGWVAFNILGPALNQYQNMRLKSTAAGLGLGAASMLLAQQADAANQVAEVAAGDNRALILAVVFVPAVGWVAFNILGPALNQLANMGDTNKPKSRRR